MSKALPNRLEFDKLMYARSALAARIEAVRSARRDYLAEILRLNKSGVSYMDIAAALGVSKARIQQLIGEARHYRGYAEALRDEQEALIAMQSFDAHERNEPPADPTRSA